MIFRVNFAIEIFKKKEAHDEPRTASCAPLGLVPRPAPREVATSVLPDAVVDQFVVGTVHRGAPWYIIVEPDDELQLHRGRHRLARGGLR